MKKIMLFCTLFLVIGSSYGMEKYHLGTMSFSANARSICNGMDKVCPDPLSRFCSYLGWMMLLPIMVFLMHQVLKILK